MINDLHHLAAAFALDALDDDERRQFEAHYPTCEMCQAEVAEFRSTAALLATTVEMTPPDALKSRIFGEIAETRQLPPVVESAIEPAIGSGAVVDLTEHRQRRWATPMLLAAAAAVILITVSAVAFIGMRSTPSGIDDVLAAPDAVVLELEGADGSVRIVWSSERDELVFYGNQLPDPGDGKVYELWAITDAGEALSAGLFKPEDGSVKKMVDVVDVDAVAFGITIEPDGGSPQATTDIIYIGNA